MKGLLDYISLSSLLWFLPVIYHLGAKLLCAMKVYLVNDVKASLSKPLVALIKKMAWFCIFKNLSGYMSITIWKDVRLDILQGWTGHLFLRSCVEKG